MGRLFQMVGGDYSCSICGIVHSSAVEACHGHFKKDKGKKSEITMYMEELREKAIEKNRKKISGEN